MLLPFVRSAGRRRFFACYVSALSSTVSPLALNTPALLVNRQAYDNNHALLRHLLADTPNVSIRPHTKAHKTGLLALEQMKAVGPQAVGVCCQTISEAEEMARAGVSDVLLTNQIVTPAKLERLLQLLSENPNLTHLGVLVDGDAGIDRLLASVSSFGASDAAIPLSVWVEVDAGQARCGVPPPPQSDEVLRLARRIVDASSATIPGATTRLRFGGLQCYHGTIQFVHGSEARQKAVQEGPVVAARAARALLESNGIPVPRVSGGGTGTFRYEAAAGAHDEVQPGSFAFMDSTYGAALADDQTFGQSLFVAGTVISMTSTARAVVDAGTKAVDQLAGPPIVWGVCGGDGSIPMEDVTYRCGGDEHGILEGPGVSTLKVGDTVFLQPSHCDPTVNLHDQFIFVGTCDGVLVAEEPIPIGARGPGC